MTLYLTWSEYWALYEAAMDAIDGPHFDQIHYLGKVRELLGEEVYEKLLRNPPVQYFVRPDAAEGPRLVDQG